MTDKQASYQQVAPELHQLLRRSNEILSERRRQGVELTPKLAREAMRGLSRYACEGREMARVLEREIENQGALITTRIYQPESDDTELPVMVYFHGGGHMCGSLEIYDSVCRRLADETTCLVLSVDYRLAPESPYPAGLSDCHAVLDQLSVLLRGLPADSEQLFLAGDSAGGNLASTVAHEVQRQASQHISGMILFYPSVDFTRSTDSHIRLGSGLLLEKNSIDWYFDNYFQGSDHYHRASPLFFDDASHFPACLIIAAGQDPLVDEGRVFHQRLQNAGIHSEYHLEDDLIHAFLKLGQLVPEHLQRVYTRVAAFVALHCDR